MGAQRFRKSERLLTPRQFKRVYAKRSLAKSPWVWIYQAANGLTYSRLGISVSNKACPHLVARNRLKRLFREFFRLHKHTLSPGVDFVIVVKSYPLKPDLDGVTRQFTKMIGDR